MTKKNATHWCNVLNEANIDDIITFKKLSVKVCEGYCDCINTRKCAFFRNTYKKPGDSYCWLVEGDCATPCSPFNNSLGKPLTFTKINHC